MYEYGRSGKFVMISVADTGSGIKEDDMQRIFEPFFPTKEEGKGSGLGLALVYGIIEQHDGWVNCYSEVGKGTVFKIYLPEYLSETGGGDEDDIDDEPMRGELKAGCRAFVVEDDLMVLEITREMLNSMGFQVVAATSYNEALTLLEGLEYSVDLVLSQIIQTNSSGISLVEYMKANAPEIPVILVSGYLDQKAHIDEISDLEVPFLSKPFNRDELVAMIRKVAKEKQ
jgi:CheY-like chemotaxis protein